MLRGACSSDIAANRLCSYKQAHLKSVFVCVCVCGGGGGGGGGGREMDLCHKQHKNK